MEKYRIDREIIDIVESRKRSKKLLAEFKDGFAINWTMAIKESFRDNLDIKYSERSPRKSMKNRREYYGTHREWTQGPRIFFKEGQIIYDTKDGYLQWEKAIRKIDFIYKIISATPNEVVYRNEANAENKVQFKDGYVEFTILKPNAEKNRIDVAEDVKLTQNQFVELLKYGQIDNSRTVAQLNLFS